MLRLIVRRVAALVPLLLIVTMVVWALLLMIPGDAGGHHRRGDSDAGAGRCRPRRARPRRSGRSSATSSWLGDVLHGDLGHVAVHQLRGR